MEKKITGYTTVDISQWHRKEHFEAFQSVAQCTYNQTVQLDITAFLKTVKKNKHKFYPAFIHILARLMNAHPEFRMAMKDGELVIWDSVHPCYTVFHEQTETFSSLWSEYHDDFRQFLHIYSQDVACYGENLAYFPKGFIENMFFVSANPWVSFTSFDLNVANMDNFFAPVFTMGKYYTQGDKVLMPLAIQVHHAVCDGFHVGRMLNELQQYCDEWQGSRPKTKLGRMDTTQVTLIHKILAAADERNLPLWIGGGWAIDARLGRVTRKHDDIDLTFPGERRGELEAIVEMLGGRVMEELDYGFLAEIGDELLDCEPAWWADEAYEIAEAPQGSCPEAAEGVIAGRPVRCNSWEAIIWDYFYYADEVPPVDWPTKHIESYRLACTSLGAEKVEVLRAAFRSRYAA